MKFAIFALAACGVMVAQAACPNQCSGRGRCGRDDKCSCFPGFMGPDCSQRMCEQAVAWIGGSESNPHAYAECSNRGTCDRETGQCVCEAGFEGSACQRSACPNSCSGHGVCEYIEELSSYASTNWAAGKIQGCKCDPGYEGEDCSKRMCPRGDDPLSIPDSTDGETWTISVTQTDAVAGEFAVQVTDLYGYTFVTRPIPIDGAGAAPSVEAELEALRNIGSIASVTDSSSVSGSLRTTTFAVQLENPIRINRIDVLYGACNDAGCQPKRTGLGASGAGTASRTIAADSSLESDECGNRGRCDSSTGKCVCYSGYYGLACERQTVLV